MNCIQTRWETWLFGDTSKGQKGDGQGGPLKVGGRSGRRKGVGWVGYGV